VAPPDEPIKASASPESFKQAVEASDRALDEIARGNLDAFMALYTDREDATVGSPFGPPPRGRDEIRQAGQRAAANYRADVQSSSRTLRAT
jgi:ketosteroid isomerase-like protein